MKGVFAMKRKEVSIQSKLAKVDVVLNDNCYVDLRIYPLGAHELTQVFNYCNSAFEKAEKLEQFMPDFVYYIKDFCDADESFFATNPDIKNTNADCPYELMAELGENLGTLVFPLSRIKELGYIEEQFVSFDMKYNCHKLSALTILYCVALALVRKGLWLQTTWCPRYD